MLRRKHQQLWVRCGRSRILLFQRFFRGGTRIDMPPFAHPVASVCMVGSMIDRDRGCEDNLFRCEIDIHIQSLPAVSDICMRRRISENGRAFAEIPRIFLIAFLFAICSRRDTLPPPHETPLPVSLSP